jgi:putative flippase GtrA
MKSIVLEIFQKYRELILYIAIGLTCVAIDLAVYLVLFNLVEFSAVLSTTISVSTATVFGFLMNARINFKVSDKMFFRFLSYSSVSAIGIGLSAALLFIFHNLLGFDGNIVKICSLPPIVFTQYLLNKTISFKKRNAKEVSFSEKQNI